MPDEATNWSRDELLHNIVPIVRKLVAMDRVPAIVFDLSRTMCESLARNVLKYCLQEDKRLAESEHARAVVEQRRMLDEIQRKQEREAQARSRFGGDDRDRERERNKEAAAMAEMPAELQREVFTLVPLRHRLTESEFDEMLSSVYKNRGGSRMRWATRLSHAPPRRGRASLGPRQEVPRGRGDFVSTTRTCGGVCDGHAGAWHSHALPLSGVCR